MTKADLVEFSRPGVQIHTIVFDGISYYFPRMHPELKDLTPRISRSQLHQTVAAVARQYAIEWKGLGAMGRPWSYDLWDLANWKPKSYRGAYKRLIFEVFSMDMWHHHLCETAIARAPQFLSYPRIRF